MNRFLPFVAATNQVLVFRGQLGGLGVLGYALFGEIWPRGPEGLPIKSELEARAPSPVKGVSFIGHSRGFYLFGISKDVATDRVDIRQLRSLQWRPFAIEHRRAVRVLLGCK